MQVIHTMPLLIRQESRETDMRMAFECLQSLSFSRDHHVVIYNQGFLSFSELNTLIFRSGVTADIIGRGKNDGIAQARQTCFEYIYARYPEVPYISEIHVDMLFPANWYEPLIDSLQRTDEPMICPGILTANGELQPLGQWIEKPASPSETIELLTRLPRKGLHPGFVHPVLHKSVLLRKLGGYDTRFLRGRQGFEDDSLLLGYTYYMGTKSDWRPKCCLESWVYHATLGQRMTLKDISREFQQNETGLIRQYGLYGIKQLSVIHGEKTAFQALFNKYIMNETGEISMTVTNDTEQKKVWDRIWSRQVSYEWDSLSQTIYDCLINNLEALQGAQIAEAGSGSGKISLKLAKEGGLVTLIDYSEHALANSVQAFHSQQAAATFLQADIRETGLSDARFDLTWNAGVLEHFNLEEQVAILKEMARITKPDGKIVVLTPSAKCLPYQVGKAAAERAGTWMYGEEHPVESLREAFSLSGITVLEETYTGFLESLAFLDFIENTAAIKEAIRIWYDTLEPQAKDYFPGYLVVTVGKVERQNWSLTNLANLEKNLLTISKNLEIESGDIEISDDLLSPELHHSIKKLQQVQTLLTDYHKNGGNAHYLNAYRDAEASYWLPLLPTLDRLLKEDNTKQPKVLDVGTAYGTLLLYCVISGADGYGVDMVDSYWPKQLEREYGIKWAQCNVEAEDIPGSQHFDIILFTEVLEHMNYNPIPVFRKFNNRLRPGGHILISTPWKRHFSPNDATDLLHMPEYRPGDSFIDKEIKYYSIDELYLLADATGFDVQSLQTFNGHIQAWLIKR